ncbi:protein phosphatase inhibitor 2 [Rhipicephalus microplus]|uniref:protein phosphatase inhibitor 2 n=1 Tax=Rhipicephalus microplus TaxID=6941 RepID=UPI003F6D24B4
MTSSSTEISKDHPSTGRPGLRKSDSSTNARSILRSPKGGSKQTSPVSSNVSVKWNEESVKRTLHPRDKDYGLMKVSEPKTPFIYDEAKKKSPVSAEVLAQRIEALHSQTLNAARAQRENDANMSEAGRERQLEFEKKRKVHYDEFFAIKEAREKVKKGECEEQAEDEVAQEEAEKLAKAQEEEAKQKTAEARAKAGAAAMARAVAAAAAKAASTVAESDKKK